MKTLAYYSGDHAAGINPDPGTWDGDIFTTPTGERWQADPAEPGPHPSTDATGVHYLIPAP